MFHYIRDVSFDPGPDFLIEANDKLGAIDKLEAFHTENGKSFDISWFTLTLVICTPSFINVKDGEVVTLK